MAERERHALRSGLRRHSVNGPRQLAPQVLYLLDEVLLFLAERLGQLSPAFGGVVRPPLMLVAKEQGQAQTVCKWPAHQSMT